MQQLHGVLIVLLLAAGCSDRPRAPALRNEPVYDNLSAGLRFLTPEGWTQQAKANLPPGPAESERLLVRYSGPPGPTPPSFEVVFQDLPESTDMVGHLSVPSHSLPGPWKAEGKPEPLTVNGVAASRYLFTQMGMTKECVAVRRGGRVYFFTAVYSSADSKSRDQIRTVVEGVTWTK